MNPCDFNLFPKLRKPHRRHRFHNVLSVRCTIGWSVADINNQHLLIGLPQFPGIQQKVFSFADDDIEGM
ncbi:hypothetical protein TNCV_1621871 [Trichonephila clavipes]|nr:hypothetical protein TNCV_1621871 [Trichonephila clavipes]